MYTTLIHPNAQTAKGARSSKPEKSKVWRALHDGEAVHVIGRIASALSVVMYVSYIPQIMNNLAGHPGTPLQPLAALCNCIMWTAYGLLKPSKDWPIVIANVPGIVLAGITFVTALL